MTKPMIRIHDLATNKIIDREMTDEELVQYEADNLKQAQEETKDIAKASAKAELLERLGISEDEVKLLLG
jgi:hypothetical protein